MRALIIASVLLTATVARADSDEKARVATLARVARATVRVNVAGFVTLMEKGKPADGVRISNGTGFVIAHRGEAYIVTNNHVVNPLTGPWKSAPRIAISFNAETTS